MIVAVPTPTKESWLPDTVATVVSDEAYANVPATDVVGGVIVVAASPTFPETLAKVDNAGAVLAVPVTFIAKLLASQRVGIVDHVEPPSADASEVKVGAGETSVSGMVVFGLQYQPIVVPLLLLTTRKYFVFASRFRGVGRLCASTPSPH